MKEDIRTKENKSLTIDEVTKIFKHSLFPGTQKENLSMEKTEQEKVFEAKIKDISENIERIHNHLNTIYKNAK